MANDGFTVERVPKYERMPPFSHDESTPDRFTRPAVDFAGPCKAPIALQDPSQFFINRKGGCKLQRSALSLLDKLIAIWTEWDSNQDYYLKELAPSIVRKDASVALTQREARIVNELRRLLSDEEWEQLPNLIAKRRAGELEFLASDRERALALEEAKRMEEEARARRKEEERARKARKDALIRRINNAFLSDFLSADQIWETDPDKDLLALDAYRSQKIGFVQGWAARELGLNLDSEQAAAVAATGGDILVVARAGSGKTRTLVTRAIFLQEHCGISPRELLLVAFNRDAAQEMRDRLADALGHDLPHVMTFHALAYALVQPEEALVLDQASADQFGLSREIQEVIDEHLRDGNYRDLIRELMLAHFREDWERIESGGFLLEDRDEFLKHRRSLPRESLQGDYVKSFGEKVIANALFEHGIDYSYERNFRWNGVNYRPDFTIPSDHGGGIVIEYFGLEGDPDYDDMAQRKREFWAERDEWIFLEYSPDDLREKGADGFAHSLIGDLRQSGIKCSRLSEDQIWKRVRRRALDRFTKAMSAFIGRCRKLNLSPADLKEMVGKHEPFSRSEELFLDIALSVYKAYLRRLKEKGKEDFNGLVWRAVDQIRRGQTRFVRDKGREQGDLAILRYVLIDEFQDFSAMLYELAKAIRFANPDVQFFCVGDDWQAINGFAGSDLRFFERFDEYFRDTSRFYLRANYRSARSIVEIGNALMHEQGQAGIAIGDDPGWARTCPVDSLNSLPFERKRHDGDEITPAVLRLVRFFLDQDWSVAMLCRRNGLPWYVKYEDQKAEPDGSLEKFADHIRAFFPEEDRARIRISTVHRYKGNEESAVIILDAVQRSFPLIHPSWVFLRIFGDSIGGIEEEERRLFYVAISRAKKALAILTDSISSSPFLDDIAKHMHIEAIDWQDLPEFQSHRDQHLEIRIKNAFAVKDKLKALGYRWDSQGRYWWKMQRSEGFSFDDLLCQQWAQDGIRVEVYSQDGERVFNG